MKEGAKSEDEIDSQFQDDNEVNGQEESKQFMMACEDMILQVDDDQRSSSSENTFSRDCQSATIRSVYNDDD